MIIIGERLNSSRKSVLEALECRDAKFVCEQAKKQEQAGAAYIDLNAAALVDGEIEGLRWAIPLLQSEVKIPLSIDTPNPKAMEAALKIHKGRALLNSVTGERSSLDALLPIIREFRPRVIALCLEETGPPASAGMAVARAEKLTDALTAAGLEAEDIFLDPLVRPIGVDTASGALFLDSVEAIKRAMPQVKTMAGLSNVSFGMPQRRLINRTFLALAMARGLDAAICDPLDAEIQATIHAAAALLGQDPSLKSYLRYSRARAKAEAEESGS
jgi:5-methyltetrahydrofolate corrinoid/iron sulfur protein methyltransferase